MNIKLIHPTACSECPRSVLFKICKYRLAFVTTIETIYTDEKVHFAQLWRNKKVHYTYNVEQLVIIQLYIVVFS